jgi:hypothetical protein
MWAFPLLDFFARTSLVGSEVLNREILAWERDQARTGRGIHGLPKVLTGPALPDPYGRFGGGPPAGRAAYGSLLPPWIPLPVRA